MTAEPFIEFSFVLDLLVRTPGTFFGIGESLLDGVGVLDDEFGRDDINVADGINGPVDMDDILVVEATNNMRKRIHLTDVGKKLVSGLHPLRETGIMINKVEHCPKGDVHDVGLTKIVYKGIQT